MAAKPPKVHHTAGIFSDMTVDGPEIGTLVVIVDRAKNLPNRKTIGKQDPYCAARLGKEAKKTDVDKRGGQTPRWDQELRFVVHDSPDYYQLKVSVFNDDKKTELIGEAWVSLTAVVVPGGGQNDLWHTLNCKGKYAGEIRIELTYYDTRPKEEKAVETRRESARQGVDDTQRESLGGPRQLKPQVKRRPLPATDSPNAIPTGAIAPDHVHSPSHQETPSRGYRSSMHATHNSVDHNSPNHAQISYQRQPQLSSHRATPTDPFQASYNTPPRTIAMTPAPVDGPQLHQAGRYEIYDPAGDTDYIPGSILGRYDGNLEDDDAETQIHYGAHPYGVHQPPPPFPWRDERVHESGDIPPPPPAHGSRHASPGAHSGMPALTHSHSAPPTAPRTFDDSRQAKSLQSSPDYRGHVQYKPPHLEDEAESYSSYPAKNDDSHFTPPRHHSHDGAYGAATGDIYSPQEDGPPPPPPVHRTNIGQMTLYQAENESHFDQSASPAPLNISSRGGSSLANRNTNSLTERHYQLQQDGFETSSPSSTERVPPQYVSGHASYPQTHRRHSGEAMMATNSRDGAYAVAHSPLVGINNGNADGFFERQDRDHRVSTGADAGASAAVLYQENTSSHHNSPMPREDGHFSSHSMYQDSNSSHASLRRRSVGPPVLYQDPSAPAHHHLSRQQALAHQETRPTSSSQGPERRRSFVQQEIEPLIATPEQRRPAPMIKPRPISPDPRMPARKSVSPHPPAPPEGRRLSGVPFSPDSYDALNPNIASASTVNEPGPQYQTPEQAKEAFRLHQRESKRAAADGPIIGTDGREIDPSDHLPSDTWAPEPERKGAKKEQSRPETRSRPTPQGAQPMPSPGQQRGVRGSPASVRPISTAAPIYAHGPADPHTPSRNRLQKKSRASASSSVMHSPSSASPLAPYSGGGTSRPDYPLREHENYGYGNSPGYAGGYGHGSPSTGVPPPVPAKVPFSSSGGGRVDSSWELAEELKRIDIGTSSGRSARRNRY